MDGRQPGEATLAVLIEEFFGSQPVDDNASQSRGSPDLLLDHAERLHELSDIRNFLDQEPPHLFRSARDNREAVLLEPPFGPDRARQW